MKIEIGVTFGRLEVMRFAEMPLRRGEFAICKCSCGAERAVRQRDLRSGKTQSCGCLGRERRLAASSKHGHARAGKITSEYRSWTMMKNRCLNSGDPNFKDYGGRGIRVCRRWMTFVNFLQDMGLKPSRKHTIERIDNNGNYQPSNCRWATKMEQGRNTRRNVFIEHEGQTKTISEWSREKGIALRTLYDRFEKRLDLFSKTNLSCTVSGKPICGARYLEPKDRR